jgi:preprotein translocase subunit SecE
VAEMANGFFKGVKSEIKKVIWPTKNQLINNTALVLLLVAALGIIILGFDMLLELLDGNLWNFIQSKIG